VYLALSHALAKGAMFLAAGCVTSRGGDDDIGRLDRVAQGMPLTLAAFALAGISLAGLPPSGGFVGKWLLLQAAFEQGQYQWAVVLLAGGLLTAAYVFRVIGHAFMQSPGAAVRGAPGTMQWAALLLAFGAVALGFLAPWAAPLLDGVVP
jgi:formate hydrogenlyase subunit 3/multisubunit Na+/H+ antiporter MnhD subunit